MEQFKEHIILNFPFKSSDIGKICKKALDYRKIINENGIPTVQKYIDQYIRKLSESHENVTYNGHIGIYLVTNNIKILFIENGNLIIGELNIKIIQNFIS